MTDSSYRFSLPFVLFALCVLGMLASAVATAQPTPSASKGGGDDLVLKKTEGQGRSSQFGAELPPVERSVDPAQYRLGPNDQLLLALPMIEAGEYPLVVSADNNVLLPRGFPLVNVRGMTLERLRAVVDSLYRARSSSYRNVTVSLVRPRSIYVSVTGDVLFPDRYVLTASDRATTAIDIANRVSNEGLTKERETEIAAMRRRERNDRLSARDLGANRVVPRWVVLRHNDGSSQKIDLLRYRATGNEADNPTLREGDEVTVLGADYSRPTVAVVGAVNTPMVLPYDAGDNALMLVRLAGGVRSDGNAQDAYLIRRTTDGLAKVPLDVADSAALAEIRIAPGDQLVVLAQDPAVTGTSRAGVVSVVGEVQRPSTYPIIPGVTMLSEVIALAGGVRSDASLNGAYITRAVDSRYRKPSSELGDKPAGVLSTSSLALDDTTRLKADLESQTNRVSVDFVEVIARGNKSRDVPLENGDEIVIPANPKNVFVRGRVANPGWIAYAPGSDFEYYITKAGGFTEAAVPGRAQVLKYGTGIWNEPGKTNILPGDEIYVPGERDLPGRTSLEIASSIISITGGIASLAFTIFTFVRELTKQP